MQPPSTPGTKPLRKSKRANEQESSQPKQDTDKKDPLEGPTTSRQEKERNGIRTSENALALRNRRHHLISRVPGQLRNGHKMKPPRAQLLNYSRQRFNSGRTIATSIVKQNNLATGFGIRVRGSLHRSANDLIGGYRQNGATS